MPKADCKIISAILARDIEVFLAVYECGSYLDGARRVNLSREAAVKAVQRININIGGKLFVRHRYGGGRGFGVKPTPLADRLYKMTKITIGLVNSASGII